MVPQRQDTYENVLALLRQAPGGLRAEVLHASLGEAISRRTLQRRLADLLAMGRIRQQGEKRGTTYYWQEEVTPKESLPAMSVASPDLLVLPLTPESNDILRYLKQPVAQRTPVGYRREFLGFYRPNETRYLSLDLSAHLHHIGRTSMGSWPAGTYARQMVDRLLIDLSWASSRLEGNTYSLLETEQLIAEGTVAEGKDQRETQMILNHKAAIEFLVDAADEVGFNRYTILNLHALLADNLLPNAAACGRLRDIPVGIGHSTYLPIAMSQLIDELFQQVLDTAEAIHDPFEQAFFIMVHIPYLQPFEDVNKRVSRLAANIPLIRKNLCPISFISVPEQGYINGTLGIYELNRVELLRDVFVWAYERACQRYVVIRQSLGEPDPFRLKYRSMITEAVQDMIRGLKGSSRSDLLTWMQERISSQDQSQFADVVLTELKQLHEGNLARHRLKPSELRAWQSSRRQSQGGQ